MPTAHRYVRVRVGSRGVADEHGVALEVIASTCGARLHLHQVSEIVNFTTCYYIILWHCNFGTRIRCFEQERFVNITDTSNSRNHRKRKLWRDRTPVQIR